jgi:transglutaminase-like putative cysteine protease
VARKLLDWVFENLAKEATVSVPNAVQVLEMRKGDCNEHAVLYAALARAAGLPARMVAGTVYNPGEGDSSGAFYYHAWNLVWLGRWVAVDPTFGQFPADATHVAFVEGGPDKDIALIGAIGRIRFEVESFG